MIGRRLGLIIIFFFKDLLIILKIHFGKGSNPSIGEIAICSR